MSRNFTTDVDTQREYFNASYFNQSGSNQIAKYETTLLKPFFHDPDKWKLTINRMRIPLSGIPLTRNNIPFQKWQVGLSYKTTSTGTNLVNKFNYVSQYNPTVIIRPNNYNIFCSSAGVYDIQQTQYNDLSVYGTDIVTNIPNGSGSTHSHRAYDLKTGTNGTIYTTNAVSPGVNNIYCTDAVTGQLYQTITLVDIIDYIASDPVTGDVYAYTIASNQETTFRYFPRTSNTTWGIGTTWQNTSFPMYEYDCLVFANNLILGGDFANNSFDVWNNQGTYIGNFVTTFSFNYVIAFNNLIFVYSHTEGKIYIYTVSNTGLFLKASIIYNPAPFSTPQILGLNYDDNVCIYSYDANNDYYKFYDVDTGNYISENVRVHNPLKISMMIFQSTQEVQDISDNPRYDIFTYQSFLNKINEAFTNAFQQMKTTLGATYLPTEPPSIIYNASTKLFSLVVEGQYLTKNADLSDQYEVYLNVDLWDQFYFPSNDITISNILYKSVIIQNYGSNAIVGTGSSTLPQFIYVQQEDSTIYSFYDLTRIIVGTLSIPVSGDGEGKTFSTNGLSSNNSINMITDIVPDTSTLSPSSALIYIPAGILRWYNLYAQQPFSKIDLIIYYETKDGNIYPVEIINNEYFSVKLEWKKGLGDF